MRKEETNVIATYLDINHYAKLNLKYNPFSYLNDLELFSVTEDRIDMESLATKIIDSDSCFVEFYGKKGRGKSTQLQMLNYKHLQKATFCKLKKRGKQSIQIIPEILIIDSFHLLPFRNRLELLNKQKKLIISSHYPHSLLSSKKEFKKKVNFSNLRLSIELLEKIVTSRIKLARIDKNKSVPKIKMIYLEQLLNYHRNNLRGIQLDLYQLLIDANQDLYEL